MFKIRENISAKNIVGGLAFLAVFIVSMVALFHSDVTKGGENFLIDLGVMIGLGGAFLCFFECNLPEDLPDDDEEFDDEEDDYDDINNDW